MGDRAAVIACAVALVACAEREGRPAQPCTFGEIGGAVQLDLSSRVDVLFVVDDSGSMADEAPRLARELPDLVRILTTGDLDLDGVEDFWPFEDLHVGVVSTDMGSWGVPTPTCAGAERGRDALLTRGGCSASAPDFLRYQWSTSTVAEAVDDAACRVSLSTAGCGFEQPLEAALKALSPSAPTDWTAPGYEPPTFFSGVGHGDGFNEGFVRPQSVLAIIPVTDEDDCSVADPDRFDVAGRTDGTTDEALRCFGDGADEARHPVERYVEGLLGLRSHSSLLIFAPIVGVPIDLAQQVDPTHGTLEPIQWERLVGPIGHERDPRMVPTEEDGGLIPSCASADGATATPPVRIVRLARALEASGAGVTLTSICDDGWQGALREIVRVGARTGSVRCLPAPLDPMACSMRAVVPEGVECEALPGGAPRLRDGAEVTEEGRAVCELTQRVPTDAERAAGVPPSGDGWYYDDYTARGERWCGGGGPWQRIATTADVPFGTQLTMRCRRFLTDSPDETCR